MRFFQFRSLNRRPYNLRNYPQIFRSYSAACRTHGPQSVQASPQRTLHKGEQTFMPGGPLGEEFHRCFNQPLGDAPVPEVWTYRQRSKEPNATPSGREVRGDEVARLSRLRMSQTDLRSNGSGQSLRRYETRSGWGARETCRKRAEKSDQPQEDQPPAACEQRCLFRVVLKLA
jgi:hypothetical protein